MKTSVSAAQGGNPWGLHEVDLWKVMSIHCLLLANDFVSITQNSDQLILPEVQKYSSQSLGDSSVIGMF